MNSTGSAHGSLRRLATSCAVLAVVLAPVAVLLGAAFNRGFGSSAWLAAAVGSAVCWVAASLALTATVLGNQLHSPVHGMLAGMIFRVAIPLVAVAVSTQLLRDAASGVTFTILGVYLVALVTETLLALRMIPAGSFSTVAKADA